MTVNGEELNAFEVFGRVLGSLAALAAKTAVATTSAVLVLRALGVI